MDEGARDSATSELLQKVLVFVSGRLVCKHLQIKRTAKNYRSQIARKAQMISWDTKGGEKEEHREQQMTLYIAIGNKALQL